MVIFIELGIEINKIREKENDEQRAGVEVQVIRRDIFWNSAKVARNQYNRRDSGLGIHFNLLHFLTGSSLVYRKDTVC